MQRVLLLFAIAVLAGRTGREVLICPYEQHSLGIVVHSEKCLEYRMQGTNFFKRLNYQDIDLRAVGICHT